MPAKVWQKRQHSLGKNAPLFFPKGRNCSPLSKNLYASLVMANTTTILLFPMGRNAENAAQFEKISMPAKVWQKRQHSLGKNAPLFFPMGRNCSPLSKTLYASLVMAITTTILLFPMGRNAENAAQFEKNKHASQGLAKTPAQAWQKCYS